ncbi:MAG: hypothetical protein EOS71_03725 [Mesorhizobium sp.]|nr:MAG: hypothetical protein EOS71_03725 [Mesorhizobium sp.]
MTAQSTGPSLITGLQLARLLDLTPRRVQQLVREGAIPKADRDRYPLVAATQGYLKWLTDGDRLVAGSASAQRVANARANEIEAKIRERLCGLIPIEDQRMSISTLLDLLRAELADLPGRLPLHIRSAVKADIAASIKRIEKTAAHAMRMAEIGRDPFGQDISNAEIELSNANQMEK